MLFLLFSLLINEANSLRQSWSTPKHTKLENKCIHIFLPFLCFASSFFLQSTHKRAKQKFKYFFLFLKKDKPFFIRFMVKPIQIQATFKCNLFVCSSLFHFFSLLDQTLSFKPIFLTQQMNWFLIKF